jgi:hypothetical protein
VQRMSLENGGTVSGVVGSRGCLRSGFGVGRQGGAGSEGQDNVY